MKYIIPPYISIFQAQDKICIGPTTEGKYLEFDNNQVNYSEIETLLTIGSTTCKSQEFDYEELYQKGVLLSYQEYKTENRNHLFFEYVSKNNVEEENILYSKILIFGAGAGGGTLTYLLAQFGFKNLIVVDNDVVNISDTLKTVVYGKKQIQQLKVDALKDKIFDNFDISLKTYNSLPFSETEIQRIIETENPDIVIKACDPDLLFRTNLNKVVWSKYIPCLHMAYSYEYLKVGPLYVNGHTGCDECMNIRQQEEYGNHYNFKDSKRLFKDYLTHPSVSFNINILANFCLKEIIFFLSKQYEYCQSVGRLIYINPLMLSISGLEIETHKKCTICNT